MKKKPSAEPLDEVSISQEAVDQLIKARTMEEYIAIAAEHGIDWNELDDEWLEAIVSGDVSELLWRQQRRQRRAGRKMNADRV